MFYDKVRERNITISILRRTGVIPVPTVTVWMRKDRGVLLLSPVYFHRDFYLKEHRTKIPLSLKTWKGFFIYENL